MASWLYRHVSLIKLDVVATVAPPDVGAVGTAGTRGCGMDVVGTEDAGVVVEVVGLRGAAGLAAAGGALPVALFEVRATLAAVPPPTTARRATTIRITLNRGVPTAVRILDMMVCLLGS